MGFQPPPQKCQAEGIRGINLNTRAGCIPRRRRDVITCFLIIHAQTDVRVTFLTTRFETRGGGGGGDTFSSSILAVPKNRAGKRRPLRSAETDRRVVGYVNGPYSFFLFCRLLWKANRNRSFLLIFFVYLFFFMNSSAAPQLSVIRGRHAYLSSAPKQRPSLGGEINEAGLTD